MRSAHLCAFKGINMRFPITPEPRLSQFQTGKVLPGHWRLIELNEQEKELMLNVELAKD